MRAHMHVRMLACDTGYQLLAGAVKPQAVDCIACHFGVLNLLDEIQPRQAPHPHLCVCLGGWVVCVRSGLRTP